MTAFDVPAAPHSEPTEDSGLTEHSGTAVRVQTAAGFRVCTIVIGDDQPEVREAIDEVLNRIPRFSVVGEAGDGDSCLERVRQTQPDLLILDVNMPGGGPHVATAAKTIRPGLHIVVFSGREDGVIERGMLAAGADQYVVKTGRVRPLVQALEIAYRQLDDGDHH